MRLGINATFLGERPTGIGVFTAELCRSFARNDGDLVVFSSTAVKGVPAASHHRSPPATMGAPRLLNNLARFFYLNTSLPRACGTRRVDVLFSPLAEFPFSGTVPQVVHVHDVHPLRFSSQFGLSALHFRLTMRLLHRFARRVTVSSSFGRGELLGFSKVHPGKVDIVNLAFDRTLFRPLDEAERPAFMAKYRIQKPYILFVGSLFPYKNVGTLVKAFLEVWGRVDRTLVIVGRRDLSGDRLPGDDRVCYMDYVPREDLPGFYSFADLYVHPSLGEGFGIPPLEAMACGTPVISSNAGSLPEVVGDAGLYFDPLDTTALGNLLLEALGNEPLRRGLVERGFRQAEKFSWDKTAEGIRASCERALSGAP